MGGRPVKLSMARSKMITDAIATGNYLVAAARQAGISERTVARWLARGRAERHRLETDPAAGRLASETCFVRFLEDVERAEADSEAALVAIWRDACRSDWRAARDSL